MKQYDPKSIEPKWQKIWADTKLYAAQDGDTTRPKYYMLTEFPYPSGDGLHAGHTREYTLGDVLSRHKRMQGHDVLFPMGYDAFGLPTENFAIKHKIKPQVATAQNVATFRQQFESLGLSIDWSREVNTTDPSYYKWTQWLFLQFFKHGLAYQDEIAINWCPFEKTGLANEEVVNGVHERCGTPVEKKLLKQWMLAITKYADRLIDGLKTVDYPPRIADQQVNWIGRSEGAEIDFKVANETITVYTTRPDTLAGATFLVLAPEHPAVTEITTTEHQAEVEKYVKHAQSETDLNRQETDRPKTGVFTGAYTENPITKDKMPVWIADYVLAGYGTGAIMAVPAHDERDFEFAQAFDLPIKQVIMPQLFDPDHPHKPGKPDTERTVAMVVLTHPTKDQFLALHYNELPWRVFITGGVDKNETELEAAQREITEETGFTDIHFVKKLPQVLESHFYAEHKDVNRKVKMHVFLFQLDSLDQSPHKRGAHEKFDLVWTNFKDMHTLWPVSELGHIIEWLQHGDSPFVGEGTLINSGQFDGLPSTEAKHVICKWLTEQSLGRLATKYRLRDWIFSRQHYWGEPIPIIHCERCAAAEARPKLSLSFYDQPTWDAIANRVKTVETRALNPDEPGRFFGDIKSGDVIAAVNKKTGERLALQVTESRRFSSIKALIRDHDWALAKSSTGTVNSLEEQTKSYAAYAPDYLDRISQNGLIAWKFQLLTKAVPVPDDQLPVTLPEVEHYEPTDTGESPLAVIADWVNVDCPKCAAPAKRETDTMPNWAGSSWYYLRYMDPHNTQAFADPAKLKYWGMVDLYLGGMEHTTLHLLYSRFWHQFFYDQGLVPTPEPYAARRGQGIVLASDGRKMSKSLGNVINPTDIIARYGADAFRLYIMFMAPYDETTPWSDERLNGVSRFLYRIWNFAEDMLNGSFVTPESVGYENSLGAFELEVDRATHKTLKKIHDDLADMRFNTVVSTLMEYVNFLTDAHRRQRLLQANALELRSRTLRTLLLMLAPSAPHLAEELWHELGEEGSVHTAPWPAYDPELIKDDIVTVVVQVNGKVRGQILAAIDATEAELINAASVDSKVAAHLQDKAIVKTVVVPRRLVNFVVK